jgi:filamentous hemagglutinin
MYAHSPRIFELRSGAAFVGRSLEEGGVGKVVLHCPYGELLQDSGADSAARRGIFSCESGAHLSARGDLKLIGRNLNLDAGQDTERSRETQSSGQFGVTLALSGYAVTAAQSVERVARAGAQHKDPRVAALHLAQAALTTTTASRPTLPCARNRIHSHGAINVPCPAAQTQATSTSSAIKATVSIGGGSFFSESNANATANKGSMLKAGHSAVLTATGQDATDTVVDGDITARGTSIVG